MIKRHKCPECSETFQDAELVELHVINRHPKESALVPPISGSAADVIAQGINSPSDFVTFMAAVLKDVAEQKMSESTARTICMVAKETTKMAELAWKVKQTKDE